MMPSSPLPRCLPPLAAGLPQKTNIMTPRKKQLLLAATVAFAAVAMGGALLPAFGGALGAWRAGSLVLAAWQALGSGEFLPVDGNKDVRRCDARCCSAAAAAAAAPWPGFLLTCPQHTARQVARMLRHCPNHSIIMIDSLKPLPSPPCLQARPVVAPAAGAAAAAERPPRAKRRQRLGARGCWGAQQLEPGERQQPLFCTKHCGGARPKGSERGGGLRRHAHCLPVLFST